MDGTCSMHREGEKPVENIGRKPHKRYHLRHPGVYSRVILKRIVEKRNFKGESGFSKLSIGSSG
jgi:hypothetical protein